MNELFDPHEIPEQPDPTAHLPQLQGSQKQRDWGHHLRKKQLTEVEELLRQWRLLIDNHRQHGRDEQATREAVAYGTALARLERLLQMDHAAWWIERRENTARELLAGAEPKPGRGGYGQ